MKEEQSAQEERRKHEKRRINSMAFGMFYSFAITVYFKKSSITFKRVEDLSSKWAI